MHTLVARVFLGSQTQVAKVEAKLKAAGVPLPEEVKAAARLKEDFPGEALPDRALTLPIPMFQLKLPGNRELNGKKKVHQPPPEPPPPPPPMSAVERLDFLLQPQHCWVPPQPQPTAQQLQPPGLYQRSLSRRQPPQRARPAAESVEETDSLQQQPQQQQQQQHVSIPEILGLAAPTQQQGQGTAPIGASPAASPRVTGTGAAGAWGEHPGIRMDYMSNSSSSYCSQDSSSGSSGSSSSGSGRSSRSSSPGKEHGVKDGGRVGQLGSGGVASKGSPVKQGKGGRPIAQKSGSSSPLREERQISPVHKSSRGRGGRRKGGAPNVPPESQVSQGKVNKREYLAASLKRLDSTLKSLQNQMHELGSTADSSEEPSPPSTFQKPRKLPDLIPCSPTSPGPHESKLCTPRRLEGKIQEPS
ncbi:hypothetical protein DUNSADRAFT_1962 [Dunaliella salina]|uniref:Uncharacterized protein n=1 Tax=Dunaliella salina TaxID=3046 RepID=A0ABQ7FWT6_DUNSA|nr:hypothetical protein DUNSADRAFT_1962 [Dunaliella salina]|eukprot:KAF5826822.1 hypothetical protein DUNSADRAFT_1962 [Dunaliella salina]